MKLTHVRDISSFAKSGIFAATEVVYVGTRMGLRMSKSNFQPWKKQNKNSAGRGVDVSGGVLVFRMAF